MLRNILFLAFLFLTSNAGAQEKLFNTEVDYKQPGMPMPPLRYILYHDTARANGNIENDSAIAAKNDGKKRKKRKETEDLSGTHKGFVKGALTNKDLDNGANLFVMMFNPTCSHCQEETIMFEKNEELFKKTKIALLAGPAMAPYLGDFIVYTHADKYASFMYLGVDSSDFIKQVYLYQALPQINIYDKDRKLIKIYSGEVAIDSLKKYIE